MHSEHDVVVIGGGPAGLSAAMFLSRCKRHVLVIDKDQSAGHLSQLHTVSCFPGFPEAVSGTELLKKIHRQAEFEGVKFVKDSVTAISENSNPITIVTESHAEYVAKAVIVATGSAQRSNFLHGEKELHNKGVYYDAVFDAPSVAKKTAAVVGRNKRAAEAALFISRFAEKTHLIIPANKLDVPEDLMERLQKNKNIEMHFSTSLKRINGHDSVSSITLLASGQEKEMHVNGVFTYVHDYHNTTAFLGKACEFSPDGSLLIDKCFSTTASGVFACGDVICARPQVPAVSAAQGIIAGMAVDSYLSKL